MTTTKIFSVLIFTSFIFISCDKKLPQHVENEINQEKAEVFTKEVTYDHEGTSYKSFAAFPADSVESKPVIFIIPEWWGLNEYAKDRANQLAEMGYFTLALDFMVTERWLITRKKQRSFHHLFMKILPWRKKHLMRPKKNFLIFRMLTNPKLWSSAIVSEERMR